MSRWRETLGEGFGTGRNKGQTRRHPVTNDTDGKVGGFHVEHWDGSQDVEVTPRTVGAKTKTQEGR